MNNLEKRTWHYLQPPSDYAMSGCPCGNENPEWSEYKNHLWCDKCQKDFIPESNGIFDGPVGINIANMLGMYFDVFNLETLQVIKQEDFLKKDGPNL